MFEHALEDSLTRMRLEGATPEECLARYPQYQDELAPMLQAVAGLGALETLEPRPEFRAQTRAQLLAHMRANPHGEQQVSWNALEDSLTRMINEGTSLEENLAQYPEFRAGLEPLLLAAQDLKALNSLKARPQFRAKTRSKLLVHMRAHPREKQPISWNSTPAFRYAASLVMLFLVLASSGTALAQNSLPGDTLYGWKLASEKIWYGFQENPVEADLALTSRRISEIDEIKGFSSLEEIGVNAYAVLLRQLAIDLAAHPEEATKVGELIQEQKEKLKNLYEESEANLPPVDELFSILDVAVPNGQRPPDAGNPNQDSQLPVVPSVVKPKKEKDQGNKPNKGDRGNSDNSNKNNSH